MKHIYTLFFVLFFGLLSCRSKQGPSDAVTNNSSSGEPSIASEQSSDAVKRKTAFNLYLLDANVPKIFAPYASIASDEEFELAQLQLLEAYADEVRSAESLNLQTGARAFGALVLRQAPTRALVPTASNVARRTTNVLPPGKTTIELPSGLSRAETSGFDGALRSMKSQVENIHKKGGEKAGTEGAGDVTADTAGDFIKTMADAGDLLALLR